MHDKFMQRAFEIARTSFAKPGTLPYGAVVVHEGKIIGEGLNCSLKNHDPTSHGEVEAIRAACEARAGVRLDGCVMYTSCEPCPMCVATMYLCGMSACYFAGGADDSAASFAELAQLDPKWARPVTAAQLRTEISLPNDKRALAMHQIMRSAGQDLLAEFVRAETASG